MIPISPTTSPAAFRSGYLSVMIQSRTPCSLEHFDDIAERFTGFQDLPVIMNILLGQIPRQIFMDSPSNQFFLRFETHPEHRLVADGHGAALCIFHKVKNAGN